MNIIWILLLLIPYCISTTYNYTLGNTAPQTFINEYMTIQPIFSPNNSLYMLKNLLDSATTSIDMQNQYILKFNYDQPWLLDGNPLMQSLVLAYQRGVKVRVILDQKVDEFNATIFLQSIGISAKYIGSGLYCHNKGIIVDGKKVSISSINWSKTSLEYNREAGVIIESEAIANYYSQVFEYDWEHGITVNPPSQSIPSFTPANVSYPNEQFINYTGSFNVTTFVNPDNSYAYDLVVNYYFGNMTKYELHAEMYLFSLSEIEKKLANDLSNNPKMDITIIMSSNVVEGSSYNSQSESEMFAAGANVYLSSDIFTYTHAKYWIIDQTYSFIYSGNWAGTSLTPAYYATYGYQANREWGIIINNVCYASFLQSKIFSFDLSISSTYKTPEPCTNYDNCGVCNGNNQNCTYIASFCSTCLKTGNCEVIGPVPTTTSSSIPIISTPFLFLTVFFILFF